ncbi:MAG TPA: Holliday junction resolvase RuvX, partial [Solirubrobacterales bacterium]|nr:Holliday junction resolvase RuvX [Solirubrobacterales bacterium]
RTFCAELEAILAVPVHAYDERLTTRMAQASRRAGASAAPDSLAAAHLLEAYLAAHSLPEEHDDD